MANKKVKSGDLKVRKVMYIVWHKDGKSKKKMQIIREKIEKTKIKKTIQKGKHGRGEDSGGEYINIRYQYKLRHTYLQFFRKK